MGTITLSYSGDLNNINVTMKASIDDADASILLAFIQSLVAGGPLSTDLAGIKVPANATPDQAWQAVGIFFLNQLQNAVVRNQQRTAIANAVAAATAAVTPIVISPI